MIVFKYEHAIDLTREAASNASIVVIPQSPKILMECHRLTCSVCQLENGIQSQLHKTEDGNQQLMQAMGVMSWEVISSCLYNRKWLTSCSDKTCTLVTHHIGIDSDSFIFMQEEFQGLICFQIDRHPLMSGLWNCNQTCKGTIEAEVGYTQKGSLMWEKWIPATRCFYCCEINMVWVQFPGRDLGHENMIMI